MAIPIKGKFFLFFLISLLFVLSSSVPVTNVSDSVSISQEDESENGNKSDRQEVLLRKLEDLVNNLTDVVAKLESKLSDSSSLSSFDDTRRPPVEKEVEDEREIQEVDEEEVEVEVEEEEEEGEFASSRNRGGAFSVTKYSPFWSERFKFVSAVRLDSYATAINVLPFRDYEGISKYFAVGDKKGRVYVFLRNGDVVIESSTKCDSPVTAMISYFSAYKNETLVVTGHESGEILLHRIYEGSSSSEDWNSVVMETIGKFSGRRNVEDEEDRFPVTLLEVHNVGRVRYILATDLSRRITVYTENGTVYGSAVPTSRPLVFLKQRLLFLTETGAGSLDLRSMKIRESECEGMNRSLARTYVFDAAERSKAYGYTSKGEIVHVLLLGDIANFKCRVRSKKKFQMKEPVVFQAIKGYLLLVNQEKVSVHNVSTQHYVRTGGPRLLFSANLDEIRTSFLSFQEPNSKHTRSKNKIVIPLIASDREKLIVLGLGGGYVAVYKSRLPVFKGEFNTVLWSSPVFVFIVFLFGAWHFFAKKKEALTSWGPDDPFGSVGAQAGQVAGTRLGQNPEEERSFTESSRRNDDVMDLRRRYVSPSRFSGGGGGGGAAGDLGPKPRADPNYGANPGSRARVEPNYGADQTSRTRVDPNYGADQTSRARVDATYGADLGSRTRVEPNYGAGGSELKFRGSALESSGFGTRRESLFVKSKNMDDES